MSVYESGVGSRWDLSTEDSVVSPVTGGNGTDGKNGGDWTGDDCARMSETVVVSRLRD